MLPSSNSHIYWLTWTPFLAPLQLSQADALALLTPEEQELCSSLKMLPRPYLVIKETYIVENARRGGMLKRKDAK
jgi:transcriptional adapter 2-alpha